MCVAVLDTYILISVVAAVSYEPKLYIFHVYPTLLEVDSKSVIKFTPVYCISLLTT